MKSKRILLTAKKKNKIKNRQKQKTQKKEKIHRGFNEETMMRAVKPL